MSTSALKAFALSLGFESVGVCEAAVSPGLSSYEDWLKKGHHAGMEYMQMQLPLRASPQSLLASARTIIAVSLSYAQEPEWAPGYPRIARYALGRDYHKVMRSKMKKLERWISSQHTGCETRACVDSAPILERDYAHLAGLGWFGKNTLLIDSKKGSWFFIGLLLTSVPFAPDTPALGSCGKCTKCIDACPTGAIVRQGGRWQIDARKCISYLTIEHRGEIPDALRSGIGEWTFGCDVCQEVCPFNQQRESQPERARRSQEVDFLKQRKWPRLTEVSQISYEDWDVLTRGSAVRRAGWEGLKRNASINLDNEALRRSERSP